MTGTPGNAPLADIRVGDVLRLRKAHPCGGDMWRVTRVGGDVGVLCLTCSRRLMVPRSRLAKQIRSVVERGQAQGGQDSLAAVEA